MTSIPPIKASGINSVSFLEATNAYRKLLLAVKTAEKNPFPILQDIISIGNAQEKAINVGAKPEMIASVRNLSNVGVDSFTTQSANQLLQSTGNKGEVSQSSPEFASLVKTLLNKVQNLRNAETQVHNFLDGGKEINTVELMSAVNTAGLALEQMVNVRNGFVDALKQLLNMPL